MEINDRIELLLKYEVIRKDLVKYFLSILEPGKKDSEISDILDQNVIPSNMLNINTEIPMLFDKVEVVPCVNSADPRIGVVEINWKLFVLGTNGMDLGKTIHKNLADLRRSIFNKSIYADKVADGKSAKRMIAFIMKILKSNIKCLEHTYTKNDISTLIQSKFRLTGAANSSFYKNSQR